MSEKYLLFSLDDEKSKKLGEVISNPTCKKIVNLLADREASETDIARELGIPINTVEYNLNKLVDAGIVEKNKGFFWSSKGKKIERYGVSNKLIVISPRKTNVYSKLKSVIPVVLISAIFSFFVFWYQGAMKAAKTVPAYAESVMTSAPSGALRTVNNASYSLEAWQWFLIAVWAGIALYILYAVFRKK